MAAAKFLLGSCGASLAFLLLGSGGLSAFAAEDEPAIVRIEVATSRAGSDFAPALEGKTVRIAGHVTERAFWNIDSYFLPVRDEEEDFGILVQGAPGVNVRGFSPGDVIEATGRIVRYNGMPVLAAEKTVKTGVSESTGSRQVALSEAGGFRNLGLPVEVEGRVTAIGDDGASEWLMLSDGQANLRAVLPKIRRDDELRLATIRAGDRVRVSGIVTQNALLPPYDRFFQLTILAPERLALLESAGMIPALLLLSACAGIGLLAVIWWVREQRNRSLRRIVRPLHVLGEEILAMTSLSEMLKKIGAVVPQAARVSGVQMYLYDRKSKQLELVRSGVHRLTGKGAAQVNLDNPANGLHAALGHCYRNKTALGIPDTRRNDFFKPDPAQQQGALSPDLPRSILALPMLAQDEIAGVMLLYRSDGVRYFHHEEQASAQHLANQVAASLKLLEQRSVREQLFKSEKLAATGQLIAGVVNDLRNPVESVLTMSQLLLFRGACEERDLRMLAAEAQRTAEIVTRLISFGRNEDAVAKPVELNGVLAGLVKFREREWKSAGIQLQDRMSREGVYVIGAQGQLEQVLLNILLYAERAVADADGGKTITVGTSLLGRRVMADVDFPAPPDTVDPFAGDEDDTGGGLAVLRGIIQSHGGDIRFELMPGGLQGRVEIELPRAHQAGMSGEAATGSAGGGSQIGKTSFKMTAVIIEPDTIVQRTFVALMAQQGHRVIPVGSADEAIDLVQRVKCDLLACTSRMPGFNWLTFYEKVRGHADEFVLLMDENDIGHSFAAGEGHILRKPIHEADFERVIAAVMLHLDRPFARAG